MGRRSLITYGILLLCVFMVGCSKKDLENSDEFITQDNDVNIDNAENADNTDNTDESENIIREEVINEEEINEDVINEEVDMAVNENIFDIQGSLFYIKELDNEIIDRITGKSYGEGADIPYSDLRYIRVLHMGFDGLTHEGELIVNKAIAEDVVEIFKELYEIGYPIEKMILVDDYDADDLKSMADNNTSAFNYRFVEGTSKRSVHSDGLAIDINPLYNPYVRTRDGKLEVLPENASEYVDRDKDNRYYIRKDDPCYNAFVSRGFTWGGEWKNSKDYQHFEKKLDD